jgi:excisionase family DNA binding protein
VEAAIDKRSSMSAIGNLNDYVKYQMAEGMAKGGSSGGAATELAVGMAIAQQIIQQQGGVPGGAAAAGGASGGGAPAASGATASTGAGIPELMNPADVAKVLGVTEADVISTIEAGDLKAKKIGSAYRVTRAALDEFLKH